MSKAAPVLYSIGNCMANFEFAKRISQPREAQLFMLCKNGTNSKIKIKSLLMEENEKRAENKSI